MGEYDRESAILPRIDEDVENKRATYNVRKLLGRGSYGAVFEVIRNKDNKKYAMKCETIHVKKSVLTMDCKVLKATAALQSSHFAKPIDRGRLDGRFKFLIMTLLGRNLWDLRIDRPEMRFSLGTALKAAEQCLIAIENLHRAGFLHRDVKPGNFAIGLRENGEHHHIFLLDFGLCRQFAVKNKDIRLPRDIAPFRGTTRYAPIAAMKSQEQSRKDDLESWLYMVVEWTSSELPWNHLKRDEKDKVLKFKLEVRENEALMNKMFVNCPKKHFQRIMLYLDTLQYIDIPDYKFVHFVLTSIYKAYRIDSSGSLDWDSANKYEGPTDTPGDGNPVSIANGGEDASWKSVSGKGKESIKRNESTKRSRSSNSCKKNESAKRNGSIKKKESVKRSSSKKSGPKESQKRSRNRPSNKDKQLESSPGHQDEGRDEKD